MLDAESVVPIAIDGRAKIRVKSNPSPPEMNGKQSYGCTASDVWLLGTCFEPLVKHSLLAQMKVEDTKSRPSITSILELLE